jgi:glycerol dehydrogenase
MNTRMNYPTTNTRIYGGPLRYIQGPGAVTAVGAQVFPLGRSAVMIADRFVLDLIGAKVQASCQMAGVQLAMLEFSGEITPAEVSRLMSDLPKASAEVVIAAGGGKGIDAGKAVAKALGVPVITLPTAASNDAPTSKIFVLYDEDHRLLSVEHLSHNPAAVIVDTEVIANAPARLLLAGIGDALSKKFEVERCAAAQGLNIFGGLGTHAATALADASYRLLREHSAAALEAIGKGELNAHVESLVESTVLLSGLCFENGGLSVAHALTRGLSAARGVGQALHGLQVAYGLIVQLVLEERGDAFLLDLFDFYDSVGLPRSLGQLGMHGSIADEELQHIAQLTLAAPHIRNFSRPLGIPEMATAMRRVEMSAAESDQLV